VVLYKRYVRRARIRVGDIMSAPPVTVGEDTGIVEASRIMVEKGIGSLIVVDSEGRLAGIVTERDLLYALARDLACRGGKVSDVMTRNVVTVRPEDSVSTAIDKMREANVRHLPVVDAEGRPVGVLSMRDILDVGADFLRLMISPY
jgi:CBS domain-containing protein